jgi:hypothetical protein
MALFDLIGTSSWFYGVKYEEPYLTCAIEEYMLQGSFLCKAATTVVVCYVSMQAVNNMQIPSTGKSLSILAVAVLIALLCLTGSMLFHTAEIFCTDDFKKFKSWDYNSNMMGYLLFNTLPLYGCVFTDLVIYFVLLLRVQKIGNNRMYTADSDENKLFIVVKRLLFYPMIFSLLLLPEAGMVLISLFVGRTIRPILYISAAAMGLNGAIISLHYFYHQNMLPDLRHVYLYSEENPVFQIGRGMSSILNWSENNNSTVNQSSAQSPQTELRDSYASSVTSDWRQTFSSESGLSGDTESKASSIMPTPPDVPPHLLHANHLPVHFSPHTHARSSQRTVSGDQGSSQSQQRTVSSASSGLFPSSRVFTHSKSTRGGSTDYDDDGHL